MYLQLVAKLGLHKLTLRQIVKLSTLPRFPYQPVANGMKIGADMRYSNALQKKAKLAQKVMKVREAAAGN